MSRSIRVAPESIPKVKSALRLHGFPSQKALAIELGLSRATITSFFNGRGVDHVNFVEISEKLGLDWHAIAYIEQEPSIDVQLSSTPPPADSAKVITKAILRHSGGVSSVAISPDSKIIASSSYDSTIKIWSLHSGELLYTLTGHTSAIVFVAIKPDGKILASQSQGGTLRLWNLHSGEPLCLLMDLEPFQVITISPNWQTLAVSQSSASIDLLDLHSGKLQRTFPAPDRRYSVFSIAISPNNQALASSQYPGTIYLWNLQTEETRPIHRLGGFYFQRAIAISPDGQILAGIGYNPGTKSDYVVLWNLHSGERLLAIQSSSHITSPITISKDGQVLIVGCFDGAVRFWNPGSGELLRTLEGHSASVTSISISSDSKILASGSQDGTVRIWNL